MKAANLANATHTNARRELDFYPTPPDVTHALMKFLRIHPCNVVWEPACGDGAMAEVIKQYGHDVIASDLRHTGYGEGGGRFSVRIKEVRCDHHQPTLQYQPRVHSARAHRGAHCCHGAEVPILARAKAHSTIQRSSTGICVAADMEAGLHGR